MFRWLAVIAIWVSLARPVLAANSVSLLLVFQHILPFRQAYPAEFLFTIFRLSFH
jgi:hypothetical protein